LSVIRALLIGRRVMRQRGSGRTRQTRETFPERAGLSRDVERDVDAAHGIAPRESFAHDLGPLVGGCPPLDQSGIHIDDPVLRHAGALIERPLEAAVDSRG
jgi:hypothetical protein